MTGARNEARSIARHERARNVTVVLLKRQVAFLDKLVVDIRLKHRKSLNRADLVAALIEAALQSGIDLSAAASVESLVDALLLVRQT